MLSRHVAAKVAIAACFIYIQFDSAFAQNKEEDLGWAFEGEVSGVWVGGNSVSRTVGLEGAATHTWTKSVFQIQAGGLRTESTLKTRFALGSVDDFELTEVSLTSTTAEAYFARSSFEYKFSAKSSAIGGIDWLRNTFSGVDSRFLLGLGAGQQWIDSKRVKFSTVYGFTYTFESEVVENPFNTGKFPGLRLSYQFEAALTSTTKFKSRMAGDWNLENTSDIRIDWSNSISVSIISSLALKPSVRLIWRNDPALKEVPLGTPDEPASGVTVLVPLQKLDSWVTLALVVTL